MVALFLWLPLLSLNNCSDPFPELDAAALLILNNQTADDRKFIFLTASSYTGNLKGTEASGMAGADAICATEKQSNFPALPGQATEYRAFLTSSSRRACTTANCGTGGSSEHLNWILSANTMYLNPAGNTIMTTNENGVVDFSSSSLNLPLTSDVAGYWTGLIDSPAWTNDLDNCSNWEDGTGGNNGMRGVGSQTDATSLGTFGNASACSNPAPFLCVRQ